MRFRDYHEPESFIINIINQGVFEIFYTKTNSFCYSVIAYSKNTFKTKIKSSITPHTSS